MNGHAIYRYEVPVDATWHTVVTTGRIVHVAARTPYFVEFWAFSGDHPPASIELRVFGTGQAIPSGAADRMTYVGTALIGDLVWHLIRRERDE